MNREYEIFAEDIASEAAQRYDGHLRSGSWGPIAETILRDVVRSMLQDGYIIPGTKYIATDMHEAKRLLKEKMERE